MKKLEVAKTILKIGTVGACGVAAYVANEKAFDNTIESAMDEVMDDEKSKPKSMFKLFAYSAGYVYTHISIYFLTVLGLAGLIMDLVNLFKKNDEA